MGMRSGGTDELNSEINVTPLVDVMLVLLIIFMITAPLLNTGVDLALPDVTAQNIDKPEGKIILSISDKRKLQLRGVEGDVGADVKWSELETKIANNAKIQGKGEIYIAADARLPYGVVVTAMAIIRNAKINKVMLLTDPTDNLDLAGLDRQ